MTAAARGPTRLIEIEGADHNDRALLDGAALIAAFVAVAERCSDSALGRGDHRRHSSRGRASAGAMA